MNNKYGTDKSTDPKDEDSEDDGGREGEEVEQGFDPNDPGSHPRSMWPYLLLLLLLLILLGVGGYYGYQAYQEYQSKKKARVPPLRQQQKGPQNLMKGQGGQQQKAGGPRQMPGQSSQAQQRPQQVPPSQQGQRRPMQQGPAQRPMQQQSRPAQGQQPKRLEPEKQELVEKYLSTATMTGEQMERLNKTDTKELRKLVQDMDKEKARKMLLKITKGVTSLEQEQKVKDWISLNEGKDSLIASHVHLSEISEEELEMLRAMSSSDINKFFAGKSKKQKLEAIHSLSKRGGFRGGASALDKLSEYDKQHTPPKQPKQTRKESAFDELSKRSSGEKKLKKDDVHDIIGRKPTEETFEHLKNLVHSDKVSQNDLHDAFSHLSQKRKVSSDKQAELLKKLIDEKKITPTQATKTLEHLTRKNDLTERKASMIKDKMKEPAIDRLKKYNEDRKKK